MHLGALLDEYMQYGVSKIFHFCAFAHNAGLRGMASAKEEMTAHAGRLFAVRGLFFVFRWRVGVSSPKLSLQPCLTGRVFKPQTLTLSPDINLVFFIIHNVVFRSHQLL